MNKLFNLIHPAIVLLAYYLFGDKWAFGAVLYFIGREIAQAEYRWIEWYGHGQRKNLPLFGAFDRRVWDAHSFWWNLMIPILVYVAWKSYSQL